MQWPLVASCLRDKERMLQWRASRNPFYCPSSWLPCCQVGHVRNGETEMRQHRQIRELIPVWINDICWWAQSEWDYLDCLKGGCLHFKPGWSDDLKCASVCGVGSFSLSLFFFSSFFSFLLFLWDCFGGCIYRKLNIKSCILFPEVNANYHVAGLPPTHTSHAWVSKPIQIKKVSWWQSEY